MTLKDLLVHVDASEAAAKRLDAACALATAFDAHLTAHLFVPEPYLPAAVGATLPPEVLRSQREHLENEAQETMARLRERADRAGVRLEMRHETALREDWSNRFARAARHVDLSIVGQADPETGDVDAELIGEAAFLDSGRPCLMIPFIGAGRLPAKRVIVAWNGSREAARAVGDALPLLARAEAVTVLVVDPDHLGKAVGAQPGADIATHLARHGLKVEVRSMPSGGLSVGDVILGAASDDGADLVVMGGYGHSRLRELILGGATQSMLDRMTVPALIAH